MTWALCLSCGEIKPSAVLSCRECGRRTCGSIALDTRFSELYLSAETLRELGKVVVAIRQVCTSDRLHYTTFWRYIEQRAPGFTGVTLSRHAVREADALLARANAPEVVLDLRQDPS